MSVQELRKERAKKLRYKKPIAKGLNWQDILRKDGTVMVYSITGPEVAAAIGCKLQDVYNSACYGQLIQHTYYAEVIDRPLSRRKDITLLTEYDRVRKVFLRKYGSASEKRDVTR